MAGWDEARHPRRGKGAAGGRGGEFVGGDVRGDDADLADESPSGGLDAAAWADLLAEAGAGRPVAVVHGVREARATVAMPDGSFRETTVDCRTARAGQVWVADDAGVWMRADDMPAPCPTSTPSPAPRPRPRHTVMAVVLVGLGGVLAGLSGLFGAGPRRRGR